MPYPTTPDAVATALLRFLREPLKYRADMLHAPDVTSNLELVVRLALGRPVEFADPALRIPAITLELGRAALFFVQQSLFREGASHYQVLGLTPDATTDALRENHRLLIHLVHPDRNNQGVVWPESVAARVNRAYSVLKDQDSRAAYDQVEADVRGKQDSRGLKPAAFSASAAGVVRRRRPIAQPVLPEWLTAGVGGFIRRHPAVTIFAVLISLSVLSISRIIWSGHEGTLTRDTPQLADGEYSPPAARGSGPQPNYGGRTPARTAPDAPAPVAGAGTQPVPPAAKAEAIPAPVVQGRSADIEPARPPAIGQAVARVPELAQAAPRIIQVRTGATAAERLPTAGVQITAAATEPVAPTAPSLMAVTAPVSLTAPPRPALMAGQGDQPVPQPAPAASISPPAAPVPAPEAIASPPLAAAPTSPATAPVPPTPLVAAASVVAAGPAAAPPRTEPPAEPAPPPSPDAPTAAEVETLIAAFISHYEGGRLDAFASLFDVDARTNEFSGRAAIRSDYGELFQRSSVRRISLRQLRWRPVGERTQANGEIAVKIVWRDGREVEQRIALEMELMRRGGRTVIARLSQLVRN